MKANPEREIRDMDLLMDALQDTVTALEGVIQSEYTQSIADVLCEWLSTKECIEDMTTELEEYESNND